MPALGRVKGGMEGHRVGQLVAVHDTVIVPIWTSPMQSLAQGIIFWSLSTRAEQLLLSSPLPEPTACTGHCQVFGDDCVNRQKTLGHRQGACTIQFSRATSEALAQVLDDR